MEYAGFWRRFGASVVDGIIIFALSMILMILSANSVATGLLIQLLYFPFFDSSRLQGSPGKYLLGMRITDMHGSRISFKTAIIRFLLKIVSGMLLCLGYLMALFTEKKQTLHDVVAKTLVVMGEVKGHNLFQVWYQQVLAVLGMVDKVPGETAGSTTYGSAAGTASSSASGSGASTYAGSTSATAPQATPADLAGLYDLFQKGILTEAEYNEKRAELLKKL